MRFDAVDAFPTSRTCSYACCLHAALLAPHSCKNTSDELPFLYEDHEQFAAFPTFPLVLPFKGTSHDVVPFPGPTLAAFPPGRLNFRGRRTGEALVTFL